MTGILVFETRSLIRSVAFLSTIPDVLFTGVFLVVAVGTGSWVYLDAKRRGRVEAAPLLGFAIGGLFLAGGVPGLVALVVSADPAVQGFPTALRILPGLVALGTYVYFR